MIVQTARQELVSRLSLLYEEREAANIANWVIEHLTQKKRIDLLLNKQLALTEMQISLFRQMMAELVTHKPVQYVLGEAWFAGFPFFVNESVLIPRPETEELANWIEKEYLSSPALYRTMIDIGTGSGCIPITVKKHLPLLSVYAVDISTDALSVATQNAKALEAEIHCSKIDFLDETQWDSLPMFDIIVSNPPYIKQSEQTTMSANVLGFEPSLALFVPDEDALLFYRKIALFSKKHLTETGLIFLEINEALGKETCELFEHHGFETVLRKDMQGKDRMIKINRR